MDTGSAIDRLEGVIEKLRSAAKKTPHFFDHVFDCPYRPGTSQIDHDAPRCKRPRGRPTFESRYTSSDIPDLIKSYLERHSLGAQEKRHDDTMYARNVTVRDMQAFVNSELRKKYNDHSISISCSTVRRYGLPPNRGHSASVLYKELVPFKQPARRNDLVEDPHAASHYAAAQVKTLREAGAFYPDEILVMSCDNRNKIPLGNTAVHHLIRPHGMHLAEQQPNAPDHSFPKHPDNAKITPAGYMELQPPRYPIHDNQFLELRVARGHHKSVVTRRCRSCHDYKHKEVPLQHRSQSAGDLRDFSDLAQEHDYKDKLGRPHITYPNSGHLNLFLFPTCFYDAVSCRHVNNLHFCLRPIVKYCGKKVLILLVDGGPDWSFKSPANLVMFGRLWTVLGLDALILGCCETLWGDIVASLPGARATSSKEATNEKQPDNNTTVRQLNDRSIPKLKKGVHQRVSSVPSVANASYTSFRLLGIEKKLNSLHSVSLNRSRQNTAKLHSMDSSVRRLTTTVETLVTTILERGRNETARDSTEADTGTLVQDSMNMVYNHDAEISEIPVAVPAVQFVQSETQLSQIIQPMSSSRSTTVSARSHAPAKLALQQPRHDFQQFESQSYEMPGSRTDAVMTKIVAESPASHIQRLDCSEMMAPCSWSTPNDLMRRDIETDYESARRSAGLMPRNLEASSRITVREPRTLHEEPTCTSRIRPSTPRLDDDIDDFADLEHVYLSSCQDDNDDEYFEMQKRNRRVIIERPDHACKAACNTLVAGVPAPKSSNDVYAIGSNPNFIISKEYYYKKMPKLGKDGEKGQRMLLVILMKMMFSERELAKCSVKGTDRNHLGARIRKEPFCWVRLGTVMEELDRYYPFSVVPLHPEQIPSYVQGWLGCISRIALHRCSPQTKNTVRVPKRPNQ